MAVIPHCMHIEVWLCRGFDAPSDFTAYSNAKLYNQLSAVELQKRIEGTGVDVYLAQPGMSKTGLFDKGDHAKWGVWFQVHPQPCAPSLSAPGPGCPVHMCPATLYHLLCAVCSKLASLRGEIRAHEESGSHAVCCCSCILSMSPFPAVLYRLLGFLSGACP